MVHDYNKDKDIIDLNLLDLEGVEGGYYRGLGRKFTIYPFIIELDSLKNLKERFLGSTIKVYE